MINLKSLFLVSISGLVCLTPLIGLGYIPLTNIAQKPSFIEPEKNLNKRSEGFKELECLKFRVDFWVDIYTKYDTDQALVIDAKTLKIHEVLDWPSDKKARKKLYKAMSAKYKGQDIKIQQGIKSKFEAGIKRYENGLGKTVHDEFKKAGLPRELALLPHVESSYENKATSKVKAIGIYQIMFYWARKMGLKSYKQLRDPEIAAKVAIKIVNNDHEDLQSWPLTITAWNQGRGAMMRAKSVHGDNICAIIDKYDGRTFGYSGENFYSAFLAVIRIVEERDIKLYGNY
jgi:membrane-bound lytic murein transglycosylase D